MGKTLVIAEKPSVAADIAKAIGGLKKETDYYEGENYIVSSAVGHLLEIKAPDEYEVKRGKWSFAHLPVIPPHFDLVPIKKTEAKLKSLNKLIKRKDVDKLINACDAGREGELIFRYIVENAKSKKTIERLWLQSMTQDSIKTAFKHLRTNEEMIPLAEAAKSRSEADWLVGINGTRAMTAFNSKDGGFFLTTVGRVQTPTLALVVRREEQIRKFVSRPYWEIHAEFDVAQGSYSGRFFDPKFVKSADNALKADRLWSEDETRRIAQICRGKVGCVSETSKPSTSSSPALFDLTTLQREANSKFGFSAKTTLSIAQALYEKHKLLTYPRTDSRALPEDYAPTVCQTMSMLNQTGWGKFSAQVLDNHWVVPGNKKIFNNTKISDHFAIIPTTQKPTTSLSEAEMKIYDLVVKRFISIFFPPAQFKNITRTTVVEGYSFLTEGKVLEQPGWLAVYGREEMSSNDILTPVLPNEQATVAEIDAVALATKPPARYTEASLLSAMESAGKEIQEAELREAMREKGIGTPATRAAIIEGLITQNYMIREGRELIPTTKAKQLLTLLTGLKIKTLSEAELTGEWEHKLSQIEKGQLSRKDFMQSIAQLTTEIVDKAKSYGAESVPLESPATLTMPCPKCGGTIIEHYKRFACTKCDYSIAKHPGGRMFDPKEVDELLKNGTIGPLDGFISKMGRPFSAILKLGPAPDFKIDFDFGNSEKTQEINVDELKEKPPVGTCPICGKNVYETESSYVCEDALKNEEKKCTFRSSKLILQQPIVREQMEKLLSTGSTDLLKDFISNRTKRKFSAYLVLDKGKVGFRFEEKSAGSTGTTKKRTRKSGS